MNPERSWLIGPNATLPEPTDLERFHDLQAQKEQVREEIASAQAREEKILAELDKVIIRLGRSVPCPNCKAPEGQACVWVYFDGASMKPTLFHRARAEKVGMG